ncbi:hypothetical protein ACHAWF_016889 [Thalassiosira exigua]
MAISARVDRGPALRRVDDRLPPGHTPGTVLQEASCHCLGNDGEGCNVDLLRAFRYDAIPPQKRTLGSSTRTDWGTLTVAWHESKGGLQTWCHECRRWSDVGAPPPGLASMSSGDRCDESGGVGISAWPSLRRRVLCPVIRGKGADLDDEDDRCCRERRRLLVYFAYPPPGISLEDAREIVVSLAWSSVAPQRGTVG